MKERPILMSTWSVQRILAGAKTQTRRVIKPQPELGKCWKSWIIDPEIMDLPIQYCPYGISEDQLWVRETHHIDHYPKGYRDRYGNPGVVHYRADPDIISQSWDGQWRPSIFMPRWASRINLEVTGVRIERVQEISWQDALAEGIYYHPADSSNVAMFSIVSPEALRTRGWDTPGCCDSPIGSFHTLWDSINAERGYSWASNPWVWVVEFKVI